MTPTYAKVVDPIISHLLVVLDRLESGEDLQPVDLSAQIKILFGKADAVLGQTDEWLLAKYALACWVDEMLVTAIWQGKTWWANNTLEWHFFNTNVKYFTFFEKAKLATQLKTRDAVEIFYVCVVLGFRGFYRPAAVATDSGPYNPDVEPQRIADDAAATGYPLTLRAWTEQFAAARGGQLPELPSVGTPPAQAYPLEGQSYLIGSLLAFAVLGAITFITVLFTS